MTSEDGKERFRTGDDLLAGRGAPALMSEKEPAIRMLKDRYSESFAITKGAREGQVHLFLIKLGMWALVRTFTFKDVSLLSYSPEKQKLEIEDALKVLESALSGRNSQMLQKLDDGVSKALQRIRLKIEAMKHVS